MNYPNYIKQFSYLIIFFPLFLVTGPFLPDLIIVCSSVLIFFVRDYYFQNFLKYRKLIIYFLIFLLVLILSSFNGSNTIYSLKSSFPYLRFFLFILFLIFLFDRYKNTISKIYNFIFYLLLFLSIDALFQYFTGTNFLGIKQDGRLSGLFGNEWVLGSFLTKFYGLYFCLNLIENKKYNFFSKKNIIKQSFLFFLIYLVVILTQERSAFFTLNLFLLTFFLFRINRNHFSFVIIIGIFLINFLFFNFNESYKKRFFASVKDQIEINHSNQNFLLKDYSGFFKTSISIFKSSPYLGAGVRTFRIECKKYNNIHKNNCSTHPHNYFFEILSETGLAGLFMLFFIYLYFAKHFLMHSLKIYKSGNNGVLCLNLLILVLFQPFITTGSFFNNWNSAINSFIIAIAIFSNYNFKETQNKSLQKLNK